jgi:acyl-CoA reductase-like NAD-dependent aldehyde dehydrogenase
MEQILEHLLAEIRTNREEMRTIQEKIKTNQEMMEVKMDANQEKMNDRQWKIKAQVASLASWINANQEEMKAMLDACLEKMEANPGELHSVVVHQEVPKEEATVETIRALDTDMGTGRQLKKQTQGNGGSRKKMAATCR